ncbi:MAG: ribonuclease R [Nitratireductor sp.]|nr:ribonuclease R [Nitratireductor sp.]
MKKQRSHGKRSSLPGREEVLAFIAENPGQAGKREIARAFGIKGNDKIALKALLKDLAEDGLIEKHGKRLMRAGDLPGVTVLDVTGRDSGGGLLARPTAWDELSEGNPPRIEILPPRGKRPVVAGIGDRVLARLDRIDEAQYNARVIKVIDKRKNAVLGILRVSGTAVRLEPVQKRSEEVALSPDDIGEAKNGDLVEVQVSRVGRHGLKRGKVIRVIGSLASEKAVSMIAIHAHELPHIFPPEALKEAESVKPISAKDARKHEDWRDLPLLTIDPADAKDHDDAIHGARDPDVEGGHIVTVAIADVAWYVRSGSAMDAEALKRGNSVYFPDRVVPMLPERISNDLCSLRENEDRPALAVRMWFDAGGRKTKHEFHRIVMKSHAKLAYTQAQAAIDCAPDEKTGPLLKDVLEPLWEAWRCMHRGREAREPLELDLPERKILLTQDGTVDRVVVPERLDAHRLVEEFMIQANVAAAETLERRKQRLVYRIHDAPSLAKLESLREFLHTMNLSLARAGNIRAAHFNQILGRVEGSEREELVNQVVLRSQSQAEYSPANIGHFGLNLMRYAHFTSPIRRYADLIVHRALIAALGLGEGGISAQEEERLEVVAADISLAERRAMQAERDTVDRLIAMHLSERVGETFDGRITGVTRAGLFVTLAQTGADGFIPISKISDEYYHFDEPSYSLISADTGLAYQMGQTVEVRLAEAQPVAGALRFDMLSQGRPTKANRGAAASRRKPHMAARRSSARRGRKR